jgi:hypothetical protein
MAALSYLFRPPHMESQMYEIYYQTLSRQAQSKLDRIADVVGYVFTSDGQMNGSALLISKNFILLPWHCFPFAEGEVVF